MADTKPQPAENEIGRLRAALDAETERCLGIQGQLNRATAEFEEFVSMAAHNLRESLRDVTSFSELIVEACAGRADSDIGQFVERVRQGTARMQSLLADMVDYSAAGTGDRQRSPTEMEMVLHQALLAADQQIAERNAIVTHDPLPAVHGDGDILTRVLHHLIRNAIEYCGEPSPRVHISSQRVNLDWVFSVKDNGPGIDLGFQSRIFGVFKRLHGKEYPGNGLGLPFCKKAIEWHGGRMWVESTPGAGAAFYFTLPPAG